MKNITQILKTTAFLLMTGTVAWGKAQTQFGDGSMLYLGNHSEVSDRKGGYYLYDSLEIRYHSSGSELFDKQYRYDTAKKVWTLYNFDYSVFDNNGLKIMYVDSAFDAFSIPNQIRETYIYNADKRQIQLIRWKWNTTLNTWEYNYRSQSTYNLDGQVDSRTFQNFRKSNSSWVNTSKSVMTYNTNNQVVETVAFSWDTITSVWVNKNRYKNTYNSYGLIATALTEDWKSGKWENYGKREYQYNTDSLLTYDTYFVWNASKSAWEGSWRNSNVYDASGGKEMAISEVYNTTKAAWENKSYSQYVLKPNDWIESWTVYNWDDVAAKWKTSSRWTPDYLSNGYEKKRSSESWSTVSNAFLPSGIYYYSYAPKSSLGTRSSKPVADPLRAYPNPASGKIQLQHMETYNSSVDVFMTDLSGRRFRMNAFVTDNGMDWEINLQAAGLSAGVYFLEVSAPQKSGTARVLVQP